ncbi:MAG: DegT/DnrJ/EryC1/StrS family aminotransferase [Betaproteobacteria bacterium]
MAVEAPVEDLAIDGGAPLRTQPFAPWPVFAEDERRASDAVLASGRVNYWTGGECKAFEEEFAAAAGVAHAISLANGTLALELGLRALGVGPGDEVIVPAKTFVATASCAVAVGATPVVCDVDPDSQNLSAATVLAAITPKTHAIIPVHLAGWPCDMTALMALARARNLVVLEDCAQAVGATWNGRPVGSFGDMAAYSFCQDKIITTGGEGGMLLTGRHDLWERAWAYKDHGKSWARVHDRAHPMGFRWLHESFGSNCRMTEMQAAIGRVQLRKVPEWVGIRRRNVAALVAGLSGLHGIRVPMPSAPAFHSYYKIYALVEPADLNPGWNAQRIMEAVVAEGVPCLQGACSEIYREKAFVDAGLGPVAPLPVARGLSDTSLMFLVHPTLTEADMRDTAHAVAKVMRAAARA